jgi:hypothetical protein
VASDPVAAALVAEHVSPSARARRFACPVPPITNRSRAGDDDDAGGAGRAGLERDKRIVDDQHLGALTDAAHDAAHDLRVTWAIDARHADADGADADVGIAALRGDRLIHQVVESFFNGQLPRRLQVRTRTA